MAISSYQVDQAMAEKQSEPSLVPVKLYKQGSKKAEPRKNGRSSQNFII